MKRLVLFLILFILGGVVGPSLPSGSGLYRVNGIWHRAIGGRDLGVVLVAQERIDLTTAETMPSNAQYRLERLTLDIDNPNTASVDEGRTFIQLLGQNGEAVSCVYTASTTPTATTLINGLNKANLSTAYTGAGTGSLKQRIFYRLAVLGEAAQVCGKSLSGTVTGMVP